MMSSSSRLQPPETALEFDHFIGINAIPRGALFHPNGQNYLYAAGGNIVIGHLTDPHSQEFLRKHDDYITCLQLSARGTFVASGQRGNNSNCVVWDFQRREIMFICEEHDFAIQAADFSHDERIVATLGAAEDGKLVFWDMSNGYVIAASNKVPAGTRCIAFNGNVRDIKRRDTSRYLCCTAGSDGVLIWDLDAVAGELMPMRMAGDGRATLTREITALAFSDDRETVFCATSTGDFLVGSFRGMRMTQAVQATKLGLFSIAAVADKHGGGVVLGCGDSSVKVFDSRFELRRETSLDGSVIGLCPSQDGIEVLAITNKGTVNRINLATLDYLPLSEAHTESVTCIAFSRAHPERFSTGSRDGTIRVWDIAEYAVTGTVLPRKEADAGIYRFYPLCLSHADILISGWSDGKILAHTEEGQALWSIDSAHPDSVTCMLLSHNRRFMMTGGAAGEVRMWELRTRDLISNLKEHKSKVTGISLSEDDTVAFTTSRDRCLLTWDLRDEKRVFCHMQRMGGINAITLSRDQRTLITVGQERTVTYWDRATEACVHKHFLDEAAAGDGDEGHSIQISPDGSLLATGGSQGVVRVWDSVSGVLLAEAAGHSRAINAVCFSPDGRQLVSIGEDGSIFVWNVYSGADTTSHADAGPRLGQGAGSGRK